MRHLKRKVTLDRKKAPRAALLKGLVMNLILYEKIQTTKAKAHALRPIAEKMITLGKKKTLAGRRQMIAFFPIENPVKKIMEVLAPRYKDRAGGYTRIIKLGERAGDGASVVQIELV